MVNVGGWRSERSITGIAEDLDHYSPRLPPVDGTGAEPPAIAASGSRRRPGIDQVNTRDSQAVNATAPAGLHPIS